MPTKTGRSLRLLIRTVPTRSFQAQSGPSRSAVSETSPHVRRTYVCDGLATKPSSRCVRSIARAAAPPARTPSAISPVTAPTASSAMRPPLQPPADPVPVANGAGAASSGAGAPGSDPPWSSRNGGEGAGAGGPARVERERRVGVGHERGVACDAERPAVEAEHEVEDTAGVAPGEQERDARDQDEQPDEPAAPGPAPVLPFPREPAAAAREHPDDDVLGNREQPPLHEDEAPRQALGVL